MLVLKYKSPSSKSEDGAELAILYLAAKELTPEILEAVVLTFAIAEATVDTADAAPATVVTLELIPATVLTLLAIPATVPIFATTPEAVSVAILLTLALVAIIFKSSTIAELAKVLRYELMSVVDLFPKHI